MRKNTVKKKTAGRPAGSIGTKSAFPRDERFSTFRCSRGFTEVVKELISTGNYKSQADVLHEALQILAMRKLPPAFYWREKIQ